MTWYLAKLVFSIGNKNHALPNQFDEQWRLILAQNEAMAMSKATTIGYSESEELLHKSGAKVEWKFLHVTDLYHFGEAMDGAELFSRIEQPENVEHYLYGLKSKAHHAMNSIQPNN